MITKNKKLLGYVFMIVFEYIFSFPIRSSIKANKTIALPQVDRAQVKRSHSIREDTPPIGSPNRPALSLGGQVTNPNAPTTRNTIVPLDISSAEGVDLLGESEKTLCATLRIFPVHTWL